MSAVHHKFTFPDPESARRFVWRMVREIETGGLQMAPIFIRDNEVQVVDGDHQAMRIAALAKESSATHLKAVRLPYPTEPPVE